MKNKQLCTFQDIITFFIFDQVLYHFLAMFEYNFIYSSTF